MTRWLVGMLVLVTPALAQDREARAKQALAASKAAQAKLAVAEKAQRAAEKTYGEAAGHAEQAKGLARAARSKVPGLVDAYRAARFAAEAQTRRLRAQRDHWRAQAKLQQARADDANLSRKDRDAAATIAAAATRQAERFGERVQALERSSPHVKRAEQLGRRATEARRKATALEDAADERQAAAARALQAMIAARLATADARAAVAKAHEDARLWVSEDPPHLVSVQLVEPDGEPIYEATWLEREDLERRKRKAADWAITNLERVRRRLIASQQDNLRPMLAAQRAYDARAEEYRTHIRNEALLKWATDSATAITSHLVPWAEQGEFKKIGLGGLAVEFVHRTHQLFNRPNYYRISKAELRGQLPGFNASQLGSRVETMVKKGSTGFALNQLALWPDKLELYKRRGALRWAVDGPLKRLGIRAVSSTKTTQTIATRLFSLTRTVGDISEKLTTGATYKTLARQAATKMSLAAVGEAAQLYMRTERVRKYLEFVLAGRDLQRMHHANNVLFHAELLTLGVIEDLKRERDKLVRRRALKVTADRVLTRVAPQHALRLTFSAPVKDVTVVLGDLTLSSAAVGKHHKMLFAPADLKIGGQSTRLAVVAVSAWQGHGLDADPATPIRLLGIGAAGRWRDREEGPDRSHRVLLERRRPPASIAILVDGSGSMEGKGLAAAKAAVARLLADRSLVTDADELALWSFSNGAVRLLCDFRADRAPIGRAAKRIAARGPTPLGRSILRAGLHLVRHGRHARKVLIVISDGIETEGTSPAAAIALLKARQVIVRRGGR